MSNVRVMVYGIVAFAVIVTSAYWLVGPSRPDVCPYNTMACVH